MNAQDKCKHCGKREGEHKYKTQACPVGRKHRLVGYSQYSRKTKFELK